MCNWSRGPSSVTCSKTFVQTIDITLKYELYLRGNAATDRMRPAENSWAKGESQSLWLPLLGLFCTYPQKNHTKEVYEAMILRGYGMDTKRKEAFHWKKGDVFSYWNWQFSRPSRSYLARKGKYMIRIQDGNYHYTEETGIHDIQLQIQRGNRWPDGSKRSGKIYPFLKFWLDSCPSLLVSTTSRTGPLTKTS